MVSPFLPMLFMGEEWAASSPFQYFVSHSDEQLVKAVREGRRAEFKDFHGEGEAPDPQSEETFRASKLNWDELAKETHRNMLNYYRALIRLRRQQPALKHPDRKNLSLTFDEAKQVLVLRRRCAQQELICLMNFSGENRDLPSGTNLTDWQQIFNSADPYWQGLTASPTFPKAATSTRIAAESMIIYSRYHV
jgi:maltooligosyltrehalose trehalohydrolase